MPQRRKADFHIWRFLCACICAAVICGIFSYAAPAYAAGSPATAPTVQPSADTLYTGDLFCPYNYDGLSGRIAHCIEQIVIQAARQFLESFLPFYEAIIIATMVLAVTIFGALMTMGALSRPAAQSFFLLFKLAGVAFFTIWLARPANINSEYGGLLDWVFNIMHGLLGIVTSYVATSSLSACSNTESYLPGFFELGREAVTAWDKIDCLFMTLLGITVTQTAAFGLIALLGNLFFTGGIGVLIFVVAIGFMLTLLFSVLRALKIYLVSVIAVAFLVCISPIIIPMLLFSPTRPLFDKWLKNMANFMLIPMFLFAYLSMMVAAYDAILFKGPSSLYYAIASEASQEENFNFRDWLELGTSGEANRDARGTPQFGSDGIPVVTGGEFVGENVPGLDAMALVGYYRVCGEATEVERQLLGEICDKVDSGEIQTMFQCALAPKVPLPGDSISLTPGQDCTELDGRPYYGFLRNEELFHFAIAPNIETDADARAKRDQGCGWNIFCHAGKAAGWAFNVLKSVVGAIWTFGGWLTQVFGDIIKAVGSFVADYCHMGTVTPGAVCDAVGGAFTVVGSVVHTVGTIGNFAGRVMMNGLAHELGELFEAWFDVDTLDLQKVASYRCKVEEGIVGSPGNIASYLPYLECPGPEDIVIDILYVFITAAVVAYLMLRWLNYIPTLGSTMVGGARIEATLPGEGKMMKASSKLQHRMDELLDKRKKMKGGGS